MPAGTAIDLIVGTYAGSGGEGLYPLSFDPDTRHWSVGAPIRSIINASYGVYAPGLARSYLLGETDDGTLGAYRGPADEWRAQAVIATVGDAPCHLALHPSEHWLAIAHYGSGSVAVFALDPSDGTPRGPIALRSNTGCGPDPLRQEAPHAHWVGFDATGTTLYCVDLGTDRILAFGFDPEAGTLSDPNIAYRAPEGSGPRHLLWHPRSPIAFLVSEMAATLTVLHVETDGTFRAGRSVSTLSGEGDGVTIAGGVALNRAADRLYVTNRGDDSVATFALDAAGNPTALDQVPSGGRSPRFVFVADDQQRLLVAHEGGPCMTAFTIAPDGRLIDPVAIAIPGAAFILPAQPIVPR